MHDKPGYDETDPCSIEAYGKNLIGKTFNDVCDEDDIRKTGVVRDPISYDEKHKDKKRKGGLGQTIEERFFHYKANNDAKPDFEKAGVELKVTPYRVIKNGDLAAKERLVLTMIDYFKIINETFESSHMWYKSRLILLVFYLYRQEIKDRFDYKIGFVDLFTPPEQDVRIIRQDFLTIRNKIRAGLAHELSESDTLYLGAATKSATSKSRRAQPCSDSPAKPRAFAFKNSYMTYVLNHYIVRGKPTYEPIVKDAIDESFEGYVADKIGRYKGYSAAELCSEFHIMIDKNKRKPKNLESMLAFRILGVKGNNAEEFVKANIAVKTIRIGKNDKIKESMSFPAFKFKALVREDWEDSTFGNYLRETRFLFIIYKLDEQDTLRLRGCQFWNIPYDDLEGDVRDVWKKTKDVLSEGLEIEIKNGIRRNNFPKATENPVCHVRPHARDSHDTYELPDGRPYPKQCFWLNNNYILKQIDKSLYEE